jgi:ABC-type oligopeptide transport system substrate-binding subunit
VKAAALLILGAAMLAGARLAGASPAARGGVFRVGFVGSSVSIDPQASYISTAWWLEYATAAKLFNYPDKRGPAGSLLRPEVASSFSVSKDGKTYTFRLRRGFHFSDGSAVTANNFKHAIDRFENHDLAVPAASYFITDEIVGAKDVHDGKALHVRGVVARGDKLIIHLTKRDGAFLSKITMPFFQATSTKLPLGREVARPYPTAGPYRFTRNAVNSLISIRRNPYWKRGPGRRRPRNVAGVDAFWGLDEQTAFQQVRAGELDELPGYYPVGVPEYKPSNFRSEPQNCTGFLALNMANHVFKDNLPLRRAVNYAVNRSAYVAQAGPYAGQPWTHIFNPGVPGWRNVSLYKRDLAKARRLAAGHLRDGKLTMYFWANSTANQNQAMIVRQDLINLGFEPENITMKGFSGGGISDPLATRGNDADIGVSRGWCSDYPDPYDWINVLFDGNGIQAENNTNTSYMNLPKWNRRMEAAARLVGPKRFKVYGQLDLDLMRQVAPIAVERTYNNRYFFSNRVDMRSLVYQGIYSDWSIPALRLK